jgi:hypothetical protein
VVAQFGPTSMTMVAAFGGPLTSGVAPAEVEEVGLPFPSGESAREASAWQHDGSGLLGNGS